MSSLYTTSKDTRSLTEKMGVYPDMSEIHGIRILVATEEGSYYTSQEFTDRPTWKEEARQALLPYETNSTKKIQILCSCHTTYNSGDMDDSFLLWIDTARPLAELLSS